MIGRTLGHYRVEKKLGEGGMGEVFLAVDTTLDRRVAVKVLPPQMAANRERLDRFEREAKTVAAINHPNIVTIHSVEQAGDLRFLTMELVDGAPLGRLIPAGGLELDKLFEIAIPLADALSAAHAAGIVHRDLKPSNVMVTREGRVKVLDFGLAKLTQEAPESGRTAVATEPLTREGSLLGTVPYMSPEQVEGRPLDHRSDIFSLGILLYELATGDRPFHGDSSPSLIASILRDDPRSVSELKVGLPRHLGRIVRHCLEKEPDRRYQSALDVRNELLDLKREVESGEASGISGAVPLTPAPRSAAGRRFFVRRALGALALILVVGGGWLLTRGPRAAPEEGVRSEPPAAPRASAQPMIVVLPFENLGAAGDEYFADGMTEEITSRLASVGGLGVISRSSAIQYKKQRPPTRSLGEELGVDFVLEGTVRWERADAGPSHVRVTPRLIRVADDISLWSESYDRALDQIFAVQSSIAEEVIRSLGLLLLEPARRAIGARPTENLEAYQAYLRGLEHWNRAGFDRERFELAGGLFRRASELDPDFLAPAATNVSVYGVLYFAFGGDEYLRLTEEAHQRVKAIGGDRPQARLAEGAYLYYVERDWEGAFAQYRAAAELQPGAAEPIEIMGYLRRRQGRLEEAVGLLERSLRLDPQNAHKCYQIGRTLRGLRSLEEADGWFQRAIALEPDNAELYVGAAENRVVWKGERGIAEARGLLSRVPDPEEDEVAMGLAVLDLWGGDNERALARLDGLEDPEALLLRAVAVERMGDSNRFAARLEACIQETGRQIQRFPGRGASSYVRGVRSWCLAAAGRIGEAAAELAVVERRVQESLDDLFGGPVGEAQLALVEARLGRTDSAIDRLERLLRTDYEGSITVEQLRLDPIWDPLRGDRRFEALLANAG